VVESLKKLWASIDGKLSFIQPTWLKIIFVAVMSFLAVRLMVFVLPEVLSLILVVALVLVLFRMFGTEDE
jgi:hypothetical protein